jgi:hypothetical protein
MVYNIQNLWVYGLWVQRLESALSKGPNRAGVSLLHLKTERDPVSEMLCFLAIYNSRRWTN